MITPTGSSLSSIQLGRLAEQKQDKQAQLASAKRINSSKDDPAGLQIASRLTAQINQANQQATNAQYDINRNNVSSAALDAINEGLLRAQTLSVQSGNPLADANAIQGELDQITEQVNAIAEQALGQSNFLAPLDASDPQATQDQLNSALQSSVEQLSSLGAASNGLARQVNTLQTSNETLSASRSRIQDTDYAQASADNQRLQTLLEITGRVKKEEEQRKGLLINQFV